MALVPLNIIKTLVEEGNASVCIKGGHYPARPTTALSTAFASGFYISVAKSDSSSPRDRNKLCEQMLSLLTRAPTEEQRNTLLSEEDHEGKTPLMRLEGRSKVDDFEYKLLTPS